jgi:hypothetical protein
MKKMALLAVLALALAAATEHQASAWCNFKMGFAFNLSFISGPSRYCLPMPPPPGFGQDCFPYFTNYGANGGNPYANAYGYPPVNWQGPAPQQAPAQPNPPPAKPHAQFRYPWGPEYQPVNYYVPFSGEIPSYWYGR